MSLTLDHIVIAVHDLEQTISDYQALGFSVVPGGAHPGRPTHHALVVFADGAYLELIAWREPAPDDRWWQQLQQHGEGIIDFALLPPSTAEVIAAAKSRGLDLQGPLDGGRLRPDGERLLWQTGRPHTQDLPFLCGDITHRSLRVPEGDVRQHSNGAAGVQSLSVAVFKLPQSVQRYLALLGPDANINVDTAAQTATITLGPTQLVLEQATPDPSAARGTAAHQLGSRGEGAFALSLSRVESDLTAAENGLSHGAVIRQEAALV